MMVLLGIAVEVQADVEINATNFPDEVFRNWLLERTSYGRDGIITDDEIAGITKISITERELTNLKGIEFFTELTSLICRFTQVTTLDLSKNTALTKLYCDHNQLTYLNISKCTALEMVRCGNNQLTSLNVTNNPALAILICFDNQLTRLNVSKCTALETLECGNNRLTTLDVSKNKVLRALNCGNNRLTVLDVSNNTKLQNLFCNQNQLTALDVSKNTDLNDIMCFCNGIRGEAMQTLVNSLVDRSETKVGLLFVYDNETSTGNEMTALQVAIAKAKNWLVKRSEGTGWVDYPGVATGTVTLNKQEVIVRKKKSVTLKATVAPSSLEDKSVTWESSDETIATVSSTGKVTGVKSGVVTITCTSVATAAKATCKVTVGTITLDKKEVIVRKKKSVTLTPTVYPTTLEDKSVTWKSSDESVATVSSDGVVTGIKSGFVTITCTSNATGLSATCEVTVGTITLNKSSVTLTVKKSVTLKPTVYPLTLEDQSVKWKSSNTKVATVSETGKVKALKAGTATITCTSNATGLSTTCKVTVKKASASARTLDGDDAELTDIEIVEVKPAVEEPFDVFNLIGHRVRQGVTSLDGLPAGVYIVKGKKVLKK